MDTISVAGKNGIVVNCHEEADTNSDGSNVVGTTLEWKPSADPVR